MDYRTHFTAAPPVETVAPGERFAVKTPSVLTRGEFPRSYEDLVIPVVGPYLVRGADVGQAVCVTILDVEVADRGAMVALPGYGAFGHLIPEPGGRTIAIRDGRCLLWEGVELDVEPMVGKIGVAVPDHAPRSNTVGNHGGNIDCKMVKPGSRVLLPVLVDGALLYVGDAHARQADGECLMTAVEVEAEITLECTLFGGGAEIRQPVILADEQVLTVGHGATLDEAVNSALYEMHRLLTDAQGWSASDTAMFMSAAADVHVCQIVNPRASAHVSVPSRYLAALAGNGS